MQRLVKGLFEFSGGAPAKRVKINLPSEGAAGIHFPHTPLFPAPLEPISFLPAAAGDGQLVSLDFVSCIYESNSAE